MKLFSSLVSFLLALVLIFSPLAISFPVHAECPVDDPGCSDNSGGGGGGSVPSTNDGQPFDLQDTSVLGSTPDNPPVPELLQQESSDYAAAQALEQANSAAWAVDHPILNFLGFKNEVVENQYTHMPGTEVNWSTGILGVLAGAVLGPIAGIAVGMADGVLNVGPRVSLSESGVKIKEGAFNFGLSNVSGVQGGAQDSLVAVSPQDVGSSDNTGGGASRPSYTDLLRIASDKLGGAGGASLVAEPDTVALGGTTQLAWQASQVTSCVGSGAWSGEKGSSGVQTVANITSTQVFNLTCTSGANRYVKTVIVTVDPNLPSVPVVQSEVGNGVSPSSSGSSQSGTVSSQGGVVVPTPATILPRPTVSLSAVPLTVVYGGSVQISWVSSNAASCIALADWPIPQSRVFSRYEIPLSGSISVGPIYDQKKFEIACFNANNAQTSASVDVTLSE